MDAMAEGSSRREGPLLDVRNLCVAFHDGETWGEVLTDVSFAVEPGEFVGIVGESGCGKSLTALSILGLLPRRGVRLTGEILFEGRDLAKLSERAMRDVRGRRISMVFQEPMSALDPVFTVGSQVAETVRRHFAIGQGEALERAVEALSAVGIASPRQVAAMYPSSLSGGMRQRVMIAMALVCEPRLLFADEPTTALDVTIQAQIMDLLLDLGERTGTAILFITHNLGLVAESCRRMLTMYAGQVVEDGPVREILAQPRFIPTPPGCWARFRNRAGARRRYPPYRGACRPRMKCRQAAGSRRAAPMSSRRATGHRTCWRAGMPAMCVAAALASSPYRVLPHERHRRGDPDSRPARRDFQGAPLAPEGKGGCGRELRGAPGRDVRGNRRVGLGQVDGGARDRLPRAAQRRPHPAFWQGPVSTELRASCVGIAARSRSSSRTPTPPSIHA